MHSAFYSESKTHSFKHSNIQAFILIPNANSLQKLSTKIPILKRSWPATIYVATTFHPTIGQHAHQSLSNTATPKLGMIPQGIRVKQAST